MKALFSSAVIIGMLLSTPSTQAQQSTACPSPTENILLQVATITLHEDARSKLKDTQALLRFVAKMPPEQVDLVDERAIMLLARLLSDPDNGVRLWVAATLAEFGRHAHSALPSLEKAYQQSIDKPISDDLPILPSTSTQYEIAKAIQTIKREMQEHDRK